jgi:hypothetical protein
MKSRTVLACFASILVMSCASAPTVPPRNYHQERDYYRALTTGEVFNEIVRCLRRIEPCPGRAEAWQRYSGPDFNSSQDLKVLDWRQEQIGESIGIIQIKIKDSGIFYDTTVNVDTVARFRPDGDLALEVKNIYGGKWAFSEGFAEAAGSLAVIGGAAIYGASKLNDAASSGAQYVGSFTLSTGSLCGEGSIRARSLSDGTVHDLKCCGWGTLGSYSYSLPRGDYELSYDIKACSGSRYAGSGVRFSVRPRANTTVRLSLGTGYYTVE